MPGSAESRPRRFLEKALDRRPAVMRDDLRQVELGGDAVVEQVPHLRRGVRVRIRPAAERQLGLARADHLAQLPRVLDASRRPDVLVAAEHDERLEAVLPRAIRVGQAVLRRVLAGQKRDDVRARHVAAEIDDEMAEVVFLLEADGAVGEEDERARRASGRAPRGRCRSTRPCSPRSRARRAAGAARPQSPASPLFNRSTSSLISRTSYTERV